MPGGVGGGESRDSSLSRLSHLDQMRKERPEIAKKIEQHWTATDTQSLLKRGHEKEKGK
jgi:hypothetical protein